MSPRTTSLSVTALCLACVVPRLASAQVSRRALSRVKTASRFVALLQADLQRALAARKVVALRVTRPTGRVVYTQDSRIDTEAWLDLSTTAGNHIAAFQFLTGQMTLNILRATMHPKNTLNPLSLEDQPVATVRAATFVYNNLPFLRVQGQRGGKTYLYLIVKTSVRDRKHRSHRHPLTLLLLFDPSAKKIDVLVKYSMFERLLEDRAQSRQMRAMSPRDRARYYRLMSQHYSQMHSINMHILNNMRSNLRLEYNERTNTYEYRYPQQ